MPHFPYILHVYNAQDVKRQRAYFRHGAYWIKGVTGILTPLYKDKMARSAFELTKANEGLIVGSVYTKTWCPLNKRMLAWFDMLPDEYTVPCARCGKPT